MENEIKILIVDDDKNSRELLKRILSYNGYSTEIAANGAEALTMARQSPPDLIISDILMPKMDGYRFCHEVKKDKNLKEIPFIFYSGYFIEPQDEKLAIGLGGTRFIAKPVNSAKFIKIINEMLEDYQTKNLDAHDESFSTDHDLFSLYEDSITRKLYTKILQLEQKTKALEESEERYRSIINDVIDISDVGICILDTDFNIVWINPSAEKFLDLKRDEAIGMSNRELITTKTGNIFYDSKNFTDKVLATYDDNSYIENFQCHVCPEGTRKERWLEHQSRPIKSGLYAGGRIEQYYDITKRKNAEDELNIRNKELKILNNITQSVHRSLNINEVYETALNEVMKLENVDMSMIYLVDETKREAILQEYRNLPEDYIRRAGTIPYPKGITWKVISTGKILNILNMEDNPDIGPAGRELGHHGILGIPIKSENKVIGVIWFLSYKERKFDNEEVRLLSTIGNQIASAIAKANLYKELSKKNRYESIIRAVSQSVHKSVNLQEVMENAVDSMTENIFAADIVSIFMVEGKEAVIKAHRGYPDWFIKKVRRIPYPKGFTWRTISSGKLQYCPDIDDDTYIGPAGRKAGTKSYVSVPIDYEGKTIGCININSFSRNSFDTDELNLLETITQQIQTAINNARYTEMIRNSENQLRIARDHLEKRVIERTLELRKSNELLKKDILNRKRVERKLEKSNVQLRRLSSQLQSIREEESSRIALEIHDDLGQKLTVLKMDLSWLDKNFTKLDEGARKILLKKIRAMSNLVDSTIDTVRNILKGLRPLMLDTIGLTAAIEWKVQNFQTRAGVITRLALPDKDINPGKDISIALFRILQESLTNIIRHANATEVDVSLIHKAHKLILEVTDNGKGFATNHITKTNSTGILGIRERVISVGGKINIRSSPGKGTRIRVSIPFNNQDNKY